MCFAKKKIYRQNFSQVSNWDIRLFLHKVLLDKSEVDSYDEYPFCVPCISNTTSLQFKKRVTFFVGENGSGKSTLIEAIAIALGFNPEGGTVNFNFKTKDTHSSLHKHLRIQRTLKKNKDGFFYRAESFYNVASNIEELNKLGLKPIFDSYGKKSLHKQSHGESFLSLILNRFSANSLFILDEPEASLSPTRQMTLMSRMYQLINENCQFIIATHSPILLGFPNADILQATGSGFEQIRYEDTEAFQITKMFLMNRQKMFEELF